MDNDMTFYWKCPHCGNIVTDIQVFILNEDCEKCGNSWKDFSPKKDGHKYVVMFGNEGCEGFLEIKEEKDLSCLGPMELRARFNSQRNIGVYVFSCEHELTPDDITYELLQNEKVKRIY